VTDDQTRAPIELRTATATNVDFAHRLITVIAVPYEQPAEEGPQQPGPRP
jgi:hypothetical protein